MNSDSSHCSVRYGTAQDAANALKSLNDEATKEKTEADQELARQVSSFQEYWSQLGEEANITPENLQNIFIELLSKANAKIKSMAPEILGDDHKLCAKVRDDIIQDDSNTIQNLETHIPTLTIRVQGSTTTGTWIRIAQFQSKNNIETELPNLVAPKPGTSATNKFCTGYHQVMVDLGISTSSDWVIFQDKVSLRLFKDQTKVHILRANDGMERIYDNSNALVEDFEKGLYRGSIILGFVGRSAVSNVKNLPTSIMKSAIDQLPDDTSENSVISHKLRKTAIDHGRECSDEQGSTNLLTEKIHCEEQRLPTILEAINVARDTVGNLNDDTNLQNIDTMSNNTRIDLTGASSKGGTFVGTWNDVADRKLGYSSFAYSLPTTTKRFQYVRAAEHWDLLKIHQRVIKLWEDTVLKYNQQTYEHTFASLKVQLLKEFAFRFAS